MASLQAVYYRAPDGSEPVRDFLDALQVEVAATLGLQIDRLNLLSDVVSLSAMEPIGSVKLDGSTASAEGLTVEDPASGQSNTAAFDIEC